MIVFRLLPFTFRATDFGVLGTDEYVTSGSNSFSLGQNSLLQTISAGANTTFLATGAARWTITLDGTIHSATTDAPAANLATGLSLLNGAAGNSNTVTLSSGSAVYGESFAILSSARGTFTNAGAVEGGIIGMAFSGMTGAGALVPAGGDSAVNLNFGATVTVTNQASGRITGDYFGIYNTQQNSLKVVNAGQIIATKSAVDGATQPIYRADFDRADYTTHNAAVFTAGRLTLTNSATGVLDGNISAMGVNSTVSNAGMIYGLVELRFAVDSGGLVDLDGDGDTSDSASQGAGLATAQKGLTLTNSGTIWGSENLVIGPDVPETNILYSVLGSAGIDVVTNTAKGLLHQSIRLFDGNDRFVNSGIVGESEAQEKSFVINQLYGDWFDYLTGFPSTSLFAVLMGAGNDTVVNRGYITGVVNMGAGDDVMTGSGRMDKAIDSAGADRFTLGAGRDLMVVSELDTSVDTFNGGAGVDVFNAVVRTDVVINLGAGTLQSYVGSVASGPIDRLIGFEDAQGGILDDLLIGSAGRNTLGGWIGADTLVGGGGADVLIGHEDGDSDVFRFLAASDSGITRTTRDTVKDFEDGIDKIDLDFDANRSLAGDQGFDYLGISFGGFSQETLVIDGVTTTAFRAGALRYYYENNNTLVMADTNGDGRADFTLLLQGQITLTADDFLFA